MEPTLEEVEEELDLVCNEALDQLEQNASNTFRFELIPFRDRRVTKFGIYRHSYTTRLQQTGGSLASLLPNDVLPELKEGVLTSAINDQVLNDPTVRDEDWLLVNMSSNRLRNTFQSHRVSVRDWVQDGTAARAASPNNKLFIGWRQREFWFNLRTDFT